MYKIYFYKDRKGNYPVFDYIKKLKRNYLKSGKGGLNNEKRFAQKQSCHWYELGRI